MAALTWREVSAPDFTGAMRGRQIAAELLKGAAGTASDALEGFAADQTQIADKAVAIEMAKYTDPVAYEAARASGAIAAAAGVKPTLLSTSALASLGARTGQLQANNLANLNYEKDLTDFTRNKEVQTALDAAKPAVNELIQAAATNDPAQIAAVREKYKAVFGNLPTEALLKTYANQTGLQGSEIGLQSSRLGLERSTLGFQTEKQEAADKKVVDQLYLDIRGRAVDREAATRELETARKSGKYTPSQLIKLENQLSGSGGYGPLYDVAGAVSGAAGGAVPIGSNDSPGNVVLGNGAFGQPPQPPEQMTANGWIQFGKDTLIPNTRNNAQLGLAGTGKGSSAMGAFQITQETLNDYGPKALGKEWNNGNVVMTLAVQDKIAKRIFEDKKGGNLKETWASLPDTRPGAYKNRTWEDMREEIAAREVNASPGAIQAALAQGAAIGIGGQTRLAQNQSTDLTVGLREALSDTSTPDQVAARLTSGEKGQLGPLDGADKGYIHNEVRRIMREANVNAAQAGQIIANSTTGVTRGFDQFASGLFDRSTGKGIKIDQRLLSANIEAARKYTPQMAALDNDQIVATVQNRAAAQAAFQTANAKLTQTLMAIERQGRTDLTASLPLLRRDVEVARAALNATNTPPAQAQPLPVAENRAAKMIGGAVSRYVPLQGL